MRIHEIYKAMVKVEESASAGSTSAGNVASFIKHGGGANVGTLFGGSYKQKRPNKKAEKKPNESIIKR